MQSNTDLEQRCRDLRLPLLAVVTKDKLKDIKYHKGTYGIIVNLQDDFTSEGVDESGTHWTGIYVEKGHAVYYDSIGMIPPADVQLWLYDHRPWMWSNEQIQSTSKQWCGTYVLHFLWFMYKHQQIKNLKERFDKFLHQYSENPDDNEQLLRRYMGSYMK